MLSGWQILVVKCRFRESTESYAELYSRDGVTSQLINLLKFHDSVLSYNEQTEDPVDVEDFEADMFSLISAVNAASTKAVRLLKLSPPVGSIAREEQWLQLGSIVNQACRTISIQDWIVRRARDLLDPMSFVIEDDEGVLAELADATPLQDWMLLNKMLQVKAEQGLLK